MSTSRQVLQKPRDKHIKNNSCRCLQFIKANQIVHIFLIISLVIINLLIYIHHINIIGSNASFTDKTMEKSEGFIHSGSDILNANSRTIKIFSNLQVKVTTYGRIINPDTIFEPDNIPMFNGKVSIVNPSLIKIPDFIEKNNTLGKYYLYFSHHHGTEIYLAVSNDSIFGPYKLYKNGVFHIKDTKYGIDHIASPDVHIVFNQSLIEMHYHTMNNEECLKALKSSTTIKTLKMFQVNPKVVAKQCTMKAISKDGLNFVDEYFYLQNNVQNNSFADKPYIYGHFYFRAFRFNKSLYAFAKNDKNGGILYGYIQYLNKWMILSKYDNIPMRHSAIYVDDNRQNVFLFTTIDVFQKGDIILSAQDMNRYKPESIWIGMIDMFNNYELKHMTQLLKPNSSIATKGLDGISLQSPAIYVENDKVYLLYGLNAEKNGIAIAKLDFIYDHTQYVSADNQIQKPDETNMLIWPRIPKTGGENFMHLLQLCNVSVIISHGGLYGRGSAYVQDEWFHYPKLQFKLTNVPYERYDKEPVTKTEIFNLTQNMISKTIGSQYDSQSVYLIQGHVPFVPSITQSISSYLFNRYKNQYYNKWKYITIIRDPVQRIISSFNYIRGDSGGWRSKAKQTKYAKYYISFIREKTKHMNINQCIDDYKNGENICKLSTNYYVKWFCGTKCDPFHITEQSLQIAIENINAHFEWIGVLEFDDISLEKFVAKFPKFASTQLRNNYLQIKQQLKFKRDQKGYKSSQYQEPSDKSFKILMDANALDYKLYHYVVEKYNYQ